MLVTSLILLLSTQLSFTLRENRPFYDLRNAEEIFNWFITAYNKIYFTKAEKLIRFQYFVNTLKNINFMNFINNDAVFDINQFSDLSKQEFELSHTGFIPDPFFLSKGNKDTACTTLYDKNITTNNAPPTLDWRNRNAVTKIEHQGKCGSCWAYSVIGNIEGQYAIKKHKLMELSKQQLVDCTVDSKGCDGGDTLKTFRSVISYGVESEADYPYTAESQRCQFDRSKVQVRIAGCNNYNITENNIKEVLYNVGPLSVVIDATGLPTYSKGIVNYCPLRELTHAVLLVGYGTENGKDYWLIKNTWGEKWGEKGYVKFRRGINACGFNNDRLASAILQI